jgi:hypothetical protein
VQISISNGFREIALAALHGLKALRTPSLRARILGEVTEACLLQSGMSPEDVHQAMGHFVEVPLEVLQASSSILLPLHTVVMAFFVFFFACRIMQALAPAQVGGGSGVASSQPNGGRRRSVALAALTSVISRRNSSGAFLMLPHGLNASSTPLPTLSTRNVSNLATTRTLSALKVLRGALQLAQRGGDGSMVRTLCSSCRSLILRGLYVYVCFC